MVTVYIADSTGLTPMQVEKIANRIIVNGVRYDAVGTSTVNGERVSVFRKSVKQSHGNCSRCNGSGIFGNHGICWNCNGSGKNVH